ncbi:sensor histidine kinase [Levilactobacillus acidifarinae]|uniref:histidine kinase n=1 Tax=Levilactobacillus acidifarinae DSM 19394 = JCM 15949 TaxID=1423715 RepID=A0A0R1LMS4_9LACO|nr:HAMP domain-containing sensor histidine kinase [Levilactobacillus acidifarinae]KRK94081.1 sensor kinase protein [Levilactobacillus acidifarinae DSM 19394]GEO69751.1 two-component sensor histidine kinase [Levilactobacillus acidifarinae]
MTKRLTTAQEIQRRFLIMLVALTLLMGLSVVGTVGYQLLKQQERISNHVVASLKRSLNDWEPDWQAWDWHLWRQNSAIDTRRTYVLANLEGKVTKTYYSPNARTFIKAKHYDIPFFEALTYTPGYGITYYRSGSRAHVSFETWVSLEPITSLLWLVAAVVTAVALLILLIGWAYVRVSARSITKPLATLSDTARQQAQSPQTKVALPVPEQPLEVHQLAQSINALLGAINQHTQQEREFIANAAHELRTPITAIRGHVQLVQRRGAAHPEIIPRSLGFIDDESAKMQRLVNSLLTLSRADRGMLKLTTLDVVPLIHETLVEKRAVFTQSITYQGPTTAVVNGNAASVQQMVSALLDNAGKYSPADQRITVRVTVGTHVTVAVEDLGSGIAAADKTKVFDRFYRSASARDQKVAGTGLGLAIVAQLAALNHVTVTIQDNQPTGSRFELTFAAPNSEKISD